MMNLEEFEAHFREYRENLRTEVHRFIDSVAIYRQVQERTADYLPELNLAPGFFRTVQDALFTTIVLWADKLFDEQGQRGLFNFLSLIEHNRRWLTTEQLQRRRAYPDGHWMLQNRVPITLASINADRERIRELSALKSFKIRRDKFHGHFDKGYFFNRCRLADEAPLKWRELDEAGELMGRIVNDYSVDFDGSSYSWNTLNIDDLSDLLSAARKGLRQD